MHDQHLTQLLSEYVTARDNLVKQHNILGVGANTFNDMIITHTTRLDTLLPILNDAELEALSELAGSLLNTRRVNR